jgi:hypothetical protein
MARGEVVAPTLGTVTRPPVVLVSDDGARRTTKQRTCGRASGLAGDRATQNGTCAGAEKATGQRILRLGLNRCAGHQDGTGKCNTTDHVVPHNVGAPRRRRVFDFARSSKVRDCKAPMEPPKLYPALEYWQP